MYRVVKYQYQYLFLLPHKYLQYAIAIGSSRSLGVCLGICLGSDLQRLDPKFNCVMQCSLLLYSYLTLT